MPAGPVSTPRAGATGVLSATGAMLYRDANGDLTDVIPGTNGQILTLVGGVPDWADPGASVRESWQADAVDAIFKAITIDIGGGAAAIQNPQTIVTGTHAVLRFADAVRRGIVWQKSALQTYTTGKDLNVNVFWAADGTDTGTARLAAAIERNESGHNLGTDAFAAAIFATTAAAPGTADELVETQIVISGASLDGITAGDPLRIFLARVGDDGVEDTLTDNLILDRIVVEEAA